MWISSTVMTVFAVLAAAAIAIPLFLFLKNKTRLGWQLLLIFTGVGTMVPLALLEKATNPKHVVLIEDGQAHAYRVLGAVHYTFPNGQEMEFSDGDYGHLIINATENPYVMERIVYGSYDNYKWPMIYRVPPMGHSFLRGFLLQYVMNEPPNEIEVRSETDKVVHFYLRKGRASDDDEYFAYEGDIEDKHAQGEGRLYDMGKLVYEGAWTEGEPTGDPEAVAALDAHFRSYSEEPVLPDSLLEE